MPTEQRAALRVGLTGGIASGKSEVAARFAALGAIVVDADRLAREVVAVGTPGHAAVAERFGSAILRADESIDRRRLADLVFADSAARAALNAIIHPLVRAAAELGEQAAGPDDIVVHDIPLLVETGQHDDFDVVVVVAANPQLQKQRMVHQRGMSPEAADARLAAQAPLADKLAVADLVIHNVGTLADLQHAVDACWTQLRAMALGRTA